MFLLRRGLHLTRGNDDAMTDLPAIRYPRPPAHVEPFVEVLGPQLALAFILRLGGAPIYAARDPRGRGLAERLIGRAHLTELHNRLGTCINVPIANGWVVLSLHSEGKSAGEIARTARLSVRTVYHYLKAGRERAAEGKPT